MFIDVEPGLTRAGARKFTFAYRLAFLRAWDACTERGDRARLLRVNNLADATVRRWIDARDRGDLEESMKKAAGTSSANVDRAELARLRTENEALRRKVEQAEATQEILGKAYELLQGITSSSDPEPQIPLALMSAEEYADWLKRRKLS